MPGQEISPACCSQRNGVALRSTIRVPQVPRHHGDTPHFAQRHPQTAGIWGLCSVCRAGRLHNPLSAACSSTRVRSQVSPGSETQESS